MLLPSAFSCDTSQPSQSPVPRLHSALFASPPASPPQLSAQHAIGNIFTTCRSLQTMLASTSPQPTGAEPITPPTSSHSQLPTPPTTHSAPLKLRLRSHKQESPAGLGITGAEHPVTRKRIVKRSTVVTRGVNKRRRPVHDDMGRGYDDLGSDVDTQSDDPNSSIDPQAPRIEKEPSPPPAPQTPKRARIAPEVIPLGLERSDYHALHADSAPLDGGQRAVGTDVVVEEDGELWSAEDDRILVELVLEKLKLSKSDWQDCARSLGRDRGSVGRRWKSLMINGDVGLKRTSRRGKIHGTWR
ncbi:hypothetical protein VTK73DRAFT_5726 [Phialemonium thermophilum]|uniref:Myb-like domain-containing protein n=1 Tax=Phialemonium thermophilum TaxID=223376 RepID=A0ABR3XY11_9PEZI